MFVSERSIVLGDNQYVVQIMCGEEAFDTLGEISPLFLPLAGVLGDEIINMDQKLEASILTSLTTSVTYAMTQPNVRQFLKGLLKDRVYMNGQKAKIGEIPFKEYMDLLVFVVKETYSDFFLGWLSTMGIEISSLNDVKQKLVDIFNKPSETSNEDAQSESQEDSSST